MRKLLLLLGGMLFLFINSASAQGTVTGKVTDANGAPLNGATIRVKNSKVGTSAGSDGSFSIIAASNAVLIVSSVNYESKEIPVNGASSLNVQLVLDVKSLSEVVVTGTGVAVSKKKLAFAVESISGDKLPKVPTADIGSALIGAVPGAQITSVGGSPGQPVNILLRGINSIRAGTLPMILVDGVEVKATSLESLDLNSYERIEIVQGPAGATIYGAQGSNGVIQLFSKKGRSSKPSVTISSSISSQELLNIGGLNKAKKHAFNVDASGNVVTSSGTPLAFDPVTGSYIDNPGTLSGFLINANSKYSNFYQGNLQWYDHYDMFFGKGTTYNNSINISGAKDKVDYSFILSHNKQKTVFKDNGDFERSNLTANIGMELLKNLRFRTTTQIAYTNSTLLDVDGRNMFYAINNARPFANFEQRDAAGFYSPYFGDAVGVNHYNFKYIQENAKVRDQTIDIVQSLNLNYKFSKFVELDAKYGLNRSSYNSRYRIAEQSHSEGADFWQYWAEWYSPRTSFGAPSVKDNTGEINDRNFVETFSNFNATATIRFDFQKDFGINLPINTTTLGGWDYRKREITDYWTYGVDAPDFVPYNTTNMATFQTARDFVSKFATYGYVLNQRVEYGDIGGFSVGFRSDYSSAFGRGSKPFTFPRGDAYINVSAFNFYDNGKIKNVLTDIKLRAAYGETGIQPGAYDRFPILATATIGSQSGLVEPIANRNPDLKVEVAKELEVGTDLGFRIGKKDWFKSINLSFTYWDRKSEDVIEEVDVAPSLGQGRQLTNAMTLASKGIQASMNINVLSSKKLSWNLITNFSKQESKVESIAGNAELIKTSGAGSSQIVIKAGDRIGQLYGFLFLNTVDAKDAAGNYYIPQAQHGSYEVASNGYVVDKNTRQPFATLLPYAMGDPNPRFNMSFINSLSFQDFLTLGFQFDWLHKSYLYNQTKEWMYRDGIHKDYDNTITINGQTEAWSAFYRGAYAIRRANGTKSYFLEDASFVRLRNVSIAFDAAKFLKVKGLSKVQLVLSGRNLWTGTNYTGMDPEVSSGASNSSWDRGVDHNTIPNVKSYQVGLNLGF